FLARLTAMRICVFRERNGFMRSFCLTIASLTFVLLFGFISAAKAQGAAPETAPPLFPGGAFISYNSVINTRGEMNGTTSGNIAPTARPSFSHEGDFNFTWGFHPDFDLTVLVPVVTNHFDSPGGTTQASVTVGPKLPTGQTHFSDNRGNRLPAGLQPGSGSTDLYLSGN